MHGVFKQGNASRIFLQIVIGLSMIGSQGGSREVVAIKCVDKGSLSKSAVNNLVTEIKLLNVLKHEHIVEMKDFFWDEGFVYMRPYYSM